MPGKDSRQGRPRAHDRAQRGADLVPDSCQRIPAPHGAEYRRLVDLCREGQATAPMGERAAALEGSRQGGADLRLGGLVSGEDRVRAQVGSAAVRTRVKICGITRREDAVAAAHAGADAIGLVFYPPSPRFLSVERAREIRDALPPFVQSVALFVNADAAQVSQVIGRVHPALLQFHGDEPPAFCAQFGLPYLKACRVMPGVDLLKYLRSYATASGWLLDSHVEEYGGVGARFDWSLVPAQLERPWVLSGGLAPDNVGAAVRRVRPWAVDVSSGVESGKGIKDAAKIAA